jgi:hypothetical protein
VTGSAGVRVPRRHAGGDCPFLWAVLPARIWVRLSCLAAPRVPARMAGSSADPPARSRLLGAGRVYLGVMHMRYVVVLGAMGLAFVAAAWGQELAPAGELSLNSAAGNQALAELLTRQPLAAEVEVAPTSAAKAPFAADTWTFQAYGSGTFASPNKGHIYRLHIGGGYYFYDGLSINAEATAAYLDIHHYDGATGGYGLGGGLDLLLRWQFLRGDGWSLYADAGAGFLESSESFPSSGTNFNFTPQAGVGGTLRLFYNVRLMAGIRWSHLSNARLIHGASHNPGFDSLMPYVGVMIPF